MGAGLGETATSETNNPQPKEGWKTTQEHERIQPAPPNSKHQHGTTLCWPRVRPAPRDKRRCASPSAPKLAPAARSGAGLLPAPLTLSRPCPAPSAAFPSAPLPTAPPPAGCLRAAAVAARPGPTHPAGAAPLTWARPSAAAFPPARREGQPGAGLAFPRARQPGTASPRCPSPRLWRSRQNGGGRRRTPRPGQQRDQGGRAVPCARGKGAWSRLSLQGSPARGTGTRSARDSPEAASASAARSSSSGSSSTVATAALGAPMAPGGEQRARSARRARGRCRGSASAPAPPPNFARRQRGSSAPQPARPPPRPGQRCALLPPGTRASPPPPPPTRRHLAPGGQRIPASPPPHTGYLGMEQPPVIRPSSSSARIRQSKRVCVGPDLSDSIHPSSWKGEVTLSPGLEASDLLCSGCQFGL